MEAGLCGVEPISVEIFMYVDNEKRARLRGEKRCVTRACVRVREKESMCGETRGLEGRSRHGTRAGGR